MYKKYYTVFCKLFNSESVRRGVCFTIRRNIKQQRRSCMQFVFVYLHGTNQYIWVLHFRLKTNVMQYSPHLFPSLRLKTADNIDWLSWNCRRNAHRTAYYLSCHVLHSLFFQLKFCCFCHTYRLQPIQRTFATKYCHV